MRALLKISLFMVLACLVTLVLWSGWLDFLSLKAFKENQDALQGWANRNFLQAYFGYFFIYVLVTGVSLPGAAIMTLAAGALFGLVKGVVLVSFASSAGATVCFLLSRSIFRDWVTKKFRDVAEATQKGLAKDGAYYLFSLRLIPVVPFFVINLVFGLTQMSAARFFLVSQIGMLPGTFAYVNAGTRISEIQSTANILSWQIILSFALLGILPWIGKGIIRTLNHYRIYKKYVRPSQFEYDIVVIGGGAAGLVSAYVGSSMQAKVALVEKHRMGGDCLYTGCVPSKALIRSGHVASLASRARDFGVAIKGVEIDFKKIFDRVQEVIKKIEPNDSIERYSKLGVECIAGDANILDPFRVQVADKTLTTRKIIIATGASPVVPNIIGLEKVKYFTSENIWNIREQPKHIIFVGGGAIGCELAQAFCRIGSRVTLLECGERLLSKEDPEVSKFVEEGLRAEGVDIRLGTSITQFDDDGAGLSSGEKLNGFDAVFFALGRVANTKGFGLEELGLKIRKNGLIEVDRSLRTSIPNIFACGDVTGPFQLTHAASYQAGYAVMNALLSPFKSFKVDYSSMPSVIYTDPEVARVGFNETDAKAFSVEHDIYKYYLSHLDRAICDGENKGFAKVVVRKGGSKIIGATIVGARAGEMISEFALAIKKGLTLADIMSTVHAYPTYAEANRFVAAEWRKKSAPAWAKRFLFKINRWRRGA